jgi:hypothetical protein
MATRVMGLQHYLNAVIFKMIELVGKMKGAILEIDFDYLYPLIPDNEKANIDANLAYIRDHGAIIKSSALSGDYRSGGASPPVLRIVDAGVPNQEINMLNQFSQMLISEILNLMGLNQARAGQTPQYQAASSALSDLTQSNYATATMILEWDRFVERTLQTVMNYLKLSLYLKVKALGNKPDLIRSLFMRYGDAVVQMALDENLILEDVGVYVKRALESKAEKRMRIMKYVELGVQQGLITTLEAIKISSIEDPDDMEKFADRELRIQERKAQKQAEKQAQMQQGGEQQLLAQKQQGEAQMQNNKIQADSANQQNAAMAGITNSMVKDAMSGTAIATNRAINTAAQHVQNAIPPALQ